MKAVTKRSVRRRIVRNDPDFTEKLHEATLKFMEEIKTMSKEELAEKLTNYVPGVPHCWFGRPVEPLTKEEPLAHGNGCPEPQIRYLDESPSQLASTDPK